MVNIRPNYYVSFAIIVRVGIAILTRSYFQPDEYFQSLEVAHHLVFGYGHLTWEWVSPEPIRSVLYPALNTPVYWLLKISKLDQTNLLVRIFELRNIYRLSCRLRSGGHAFFTGCWRLAPTFGFVGSLERSLVQDMPPSLYAESI